MLCIYALRTLVELYLELKITESANLLCCMRASINGLGEYLPCVCPWSIGLLR